MKKSTKVFIYLLLGFICPFLVSVFLTIQSTAEGTQSFCGFDDIGTLTWFEGDFVTMLAAKDEVSCFGLWYGWDSVRRRCFAISNRTDPLSAPDIEITLSRDCKEIRNRLSIDGLETR